MCGTQGVCQREGARGEQERVSEAEAAAADREGAERISGVDLQSWFAANFLTHHTLM